MLEEIAAGLLRGHVRVTMLLTVAVGAPRGWVLRQQDGELPRQKHPGRGGDALRLSGLPYRLGHGERDRGQFDEPSYVFSACAAAALYRRAMLDGVGLFDEDFVSYCEDGDLNFRAQLAGYRCLYVPDVVVYHMGSASTGGKRSATATRFGTRNSLSLLVKNLPGAAAPHVLPSIVAGQL